MQILLSSITYFILSFACRSQKVSGGLISAKEEKVAWDFSHEGGGQPLEQPSKTFMFENLFCQTKWTSERTKLMKFSIT